VTKTYRIGAIGFAHGHIHGLIDSFTRLPNVEWVACADTEPGAPATARTTGFNPGVKRYQDATGNMKVYDDYRELLDKEQLDIAIFCPPNTYHGEVAEAIAAKGVHMLTEKPMSASLSDALRMVRAARANNVSLMINWPTTWSPAVRTVKRLIEEGTIGDVWEVKWRNGGSMGPMSYSEPQPSGPEKGAAWWHQSAPGGGAFLDYCCYGACLARWYLDEPATAALGIKANLTSHYGDAEDNAVMTVRFPRALAILEATWSTWNVGVPTGPIIYGTRGTLVVNRKMGVGGDHPTQAVHVFTSRAHGLTDPDEVIEPDPLPEGRTTLAEEFIHHLETGEALHPTLDMMQNLEVMAILDAGIRSAASGTLELVNDATWCIG
jgi:predicted dehydrogenase